MTQHNATCVLPDEAALRAALAAGLSYEHRWTTHSRWLGDLICEIAETKYPCGSDQWARFNEIETRALLRE